MKTTAKVELCFTDKALNRTVEVEYKALKNASRNLDRINAAVEKAYSGEDWVRWNLIDLGY